MTVSGEAATLDTGASAREVTMRQITASTARHIERLLHNLTLEEKVAMTAGADYWHTHAVPRLGIPAIKMTDGPHGARTVADDGSTIKGNCYPTGSALAATWDIDLVNRVGTAIGREAREKGCSILLGPCVNIQRSPLAGRNFESYSEDPYLSSRMTIAHIRGVQSQNVATCVKHYACNNSEFRRFTISSEVPERALREIYLPSFEAAVKEAGSLSMMSSYNRVNGEYSSESPLLLTQLARKEWGLEGPVISDWFGTYSTAAPANAGLDMEMPGPGRFFGGALLAAVREGKVSEDCLNEKVRRLLTVMARLGVLQRARQPLKTISDTPRRRILARKALGEAIVLLKNAGGILPLNMRRTKTIAVIGPNADNPCIEGGGSSRVRPYYVVSLLQAVRERYGKDVRVIYEPGCLINRYTKSIDPDDFTIPGDNEQGLLGEYYTTGDLSGEPFLTRVDWQFTFAFVTQVGGVAASDLGRTRSARWRGRFTAKASGVQTVGVMTDGLFRVYIDGKLLLDAWEPHLTERGDDRQERTAKFRAAKSRSYEVRVEYRANPASRSAMPRFRLSCEPPAPTRLVERAVKAAAAAEVAILVVGVNDDWESEGFDRVDMELPGRQNELIEKVAAVNPRTVVVLNNGSPLAIDRWLDKVPGVVEGWLGGQEVGYAVADVLFGDVNPSGRLPTTFPVRLEDNPAYVNYPGEYGKVLYGEGIFVGYRYYDMKKVQPLFPFGYGLSYTAFRYDNLRLDRIAGTEEDSVTVNIDVTNTGRRAGAEVVQVYVHDVESRLARPPQELKGFARVFLRRGETKTVAIKLDRRSFACWDPDSQAWVVEPGEFEIRVGGSSRDIRATAAYRIYDHEKTEGQS